MSTEFLQIILTSLGVGLVMVACFILIMCLCCNTKKMKYNRRAYGRRISVDSPDIDMFPDTMNQTNIMMNNGRNDEFNTIHYTTDMNNFNTDYYTNSNDIANNDTTVHHNSGGHHPSHHDSSCHTTSHHDSGHTTSHHDSGGGCDSGGGGFDSGGGGCDDGGGGCDSGGGCDND